jgi:hypothetical protein
MGTVVFTSPLYDEQVWDDVHVKVEVEDGLTSYEEARLIVINEETSEEVVYSQPGPGPLWSFHWPAHPDNGFGEGRYILRAEVDQLTAPSTCSASTSIMVTLAP